MWQTENITRGCVHFCWSWRYICIGTEKIGHLKMGERTLQCVFSFSLLCGQHGHYVGSFSKSNMASEKLVSWFKPHDKKAFTRARGHFCWGWRCICKKEKRRPKNQPRGEDTWGFVLTEAGLGISFPGNSLDWWMEVQEEALTWAGDSVLPGVEVTVVATKSAGEQK